MKVHGVIFPDGRVQWIGYEPMGASLIGVRLNAQVPSITVHFRGGSYWDNGGKHYCPAHIDVHAISDFRRGADRDTFKFTVGMLLAEFHPTVKVAAREAMEELRNFKE